MKNNYYQIFKSANLHLIFLLFICSISACSPARRLERLVSRHAELRIADTLQIHDTITRPAIVADTSLLLTRFPDTVVITRDRLEISLIKVHDTLHVTGKCKADTIIRTLRVPVERIKLVKEHGSILSKLLWILAAVGVVGILWKIISG